MHGIALGFCWIYHSITDPSFLSILILITNTLILILMFLTLTQLQRQELLDGADLEAMKRQFQTQGDMVAGASDITESLRRSRAMMAQQLQANTGTLEVLGAHESDLTFLADQGRGRGEV